MAYGNRGRQDSNSSTASQYSVFTFSTGSSNSASTSATVPDTYRANLPTGYLPCEFVGYGACDQNFALDDVEGWVGHIITEHFREKLPKKVMCWYCDLWTFDYNTVGDRRKNFENRMWHIRDHILEEGKTAHDIRPDHHLNTHLKKKGLITEHLYNVVRRYAEVPQPGWILPHDGVPEGYRDSRGEREFNDPIGDRRKHRKHEHKSGKSRR